MTTRRTFLKDLGLLGAAGAVSPLAVSPSVADEPDPEGATMPKKPVSAESAQRVAPTPAQKRWMELGFGLFLHFGINTYYDTEWSDGTLDPARYNPTELDTDQWMRAAKAAGMKYCVLVTKHIDGFCNWPTRHTDYCVRSTPYRGDLVRAVADSARKHNLELGLYYALWDRREKSHDQNDFAYVDFVKRQLEELLRGYGPIVELWFDGFWKKQTTGWTPKPDPTKTSPDELRRRGEDFIRAWRYEGAYRWQMDHLYQFVKQIQPDCLVLNNATTAYPGIPLHPVDIRSGEKATQAVDYPKVWRFLGKDIYLPMQVETTLSQEGRVMFKSGSWFWHEWDHSVASKEQILGWLANARRMEANLLLNAGPMADGKLRPEDEKALRGLRE